MINPYVVGPMAIRTAIWYQGESNVGQALYYDCAMKALIRDWREKFRRDDHGLSTFGLVQIAPCACYGPDPVWGNSNAGDLRQAQLSPVV